MTTHSDNTFLDDFLSELGLDPAAPDVINSIADAEAHARIIETLVRLRRDQDLTQREVAERMETTQSRVSSFERLGGDPRLSTLFRYARAVDARLRVNAVPIDCKWETVVVPAFTSTEKADVYWVNAPAVTFTVGEAVSA